MARHDYERLRVAGNPHDHPAALPYSLRASPASPKLNANLLRRRTHLMRKSQGFLTTRPELLHAPPSTLQNQVADPTHYTTTAAHIPSRHTRYCTYIIPGTSSRSQAADPTHYATYMASRPPKFERDAISTLIQLLDEDTSPAAPGFRVHVAHLADAGALDMIKVRLARGVLGCVHVSSSRCNCCSLEGGTDGCNGGRTAVNA